jgi:hypothetical protein
MKIIVDIQTCKDCRHIDHSGAFTPGGAKLICGHREACNLATLGIKAPEKYDWKYRILPNIIPDWCPLKNGCKY